MMKSNATPALPSQNWFLQFLEETEMILIIQCSDFLSYLEWMHQDWGSVIFAVIFHSKFPTQSILNT